MYETQQRTLSVFTLLTIAIPATALAQTAVDIESGSVTFEASTNMPGVEIKGKSNTLSAHAEGSRDGAGLTIHKVEATVAIRSLLTGMKVRDEHMRRYIFTTADGQEPDLHFSAETNTCSADKSPREYTCRLTGNLSIRGMSRPLDVKLRIREQSGSFKADGDGVVKLSDYGIAPPSQFGVTTNNEVKIHLEFTGSQKRTAVSSLGAAH